MDEKLYNQAKGMDLLDQFERILANDLFIDEVGFIHPSQFRILTEEVTSAHSPSAENVVQLNKGIFRSESSGIDILKHENILFWSKDHKLGISTQILVPLYKEAKGAFMAAVGQYKKCMEASVMIDDELLCSSLSLQKYVENEVMKHSRALLLLSADFGTAWNSRKWAISMIAGESINFPEIVNNESEFVEKIVENSKMNFRAWNYRCLLSVYMTGEQVQHELKKSRNWAGLHVADNCCFHYCRRLLSRLLEDHCYHRVPSSPCCNCDISEVWKEELECNKLLILRYVGREALWCHRRFVSLCWIKHFEQKEHINKFLDSELQLLQHCTGIMDDEFEDFEVQAELCVTYMLWLAKEIPLIHGKELRGKLGCLNLKAPLKGKNVFWSLFDDSHESR